MNGERARNLLRGSEVLERSQAKNPTRESGIDRIHLLVFID